METSFKMFGNLHLHSTHSDGVYTPQELARIAKEEGYGAVALTDHDTVSGNGELKAECEKLGMECIFGAEFTVETDARFGVDFHVVGFDFDPEEPKMKEYLRKRSENETDQTKVLFERGLEKGTISGITWKEVLDFNRGVTWLCNNHVFSAMKAKGLVKDTDYRAFFTENFGKHRYEVPILHPFVTIDETIGLIKNAGGLAVVAHPVGKRLDCIDALIGMGLEGIEVWHPDLTKEEQRRAYEIALEKNLYISGGSDHGGLCGGFAAMCEDPNNNPWYLEPCSSGTTEKYFYELKNRSISDRKK